MRVQLIMVCGLMASASFSNAGTITLFDGTFNDADWALVADGTNRGGPTTIQFPFGGDPGQFRQIRNNSPNLSFFFEVGFAWNFNTAQPYDPATGAIESLTYSEDSLSTFGGTQTGHMALRQDGFLYRSITSFQSESNTTEWGNTVLSDLTSQDFEVFFNNQFLPTGNPDFSESGDIIEFGFLRRNEGSNGFNTGSGIDNWRVELTTAGIPEPSSMLLMLCAMGVVLGVSVKRGHS